MANLELTHNDGIFVLTQRNADNANALSLETFELFNSLLDEVEHSEGNSALVITSDSDKFWCAGLDLKWVKALMADKATHKIKEQLDPFLKRLALLNTPTIACITGHCYGGGALMAAACDYRLMRPSQGNFSLPEIDVKLPFSPLMQATLELLPNQLAVYQLAISGKPITGEEALALGITDTLADDDILEQALAVAANLQQKDRATFTAIKHQFRRAIAAH